MSFQGSQREEVRKYAQPSTKPCATTLSNTSPLSVVLKKQEKQNGTSLSNLGYSETQRIKRPSSMASTTTIVINEKAKALRDEICTLDSEIQLLQRSLKTAITNKEKRQSVSSNR